MITRTGEYALRALVHLARHPRREFVLARDLARAARVPANYLAKILQTLARAGLLESRKGLRGGFRVARPLHKINLLQVLDPLERVDRYEGCILGQPKCSDENACPLHKVWTEVTLAYAGSLKKMTLEDLAQVPKGEVPNGSE
jgi:Rrf2 family protein